MLEKFHILLVIFVVILCCATSGLAKNGKVVMPWMCLERCKENINADLAQIKEHVDYLTAVSFEDYDLGYNSTLVYNGFTSVNGIIQSLGLAAYPMITTVNIDKMRQLFANPQPFIDTCIEAAKTYGYTGYNIDFEPSGNVCNSNDAIAFANFLTNFANQLHRVNKTLSVDIASWSPLWDFSLLGKTTVDKVITMDTYCGSLDLFKTRLLKIKQYVPLEKVGIGLESVNPNNGKPFSDDEMKARFDFIMENNIQEIDIWDTPVPDNWWKFIAQFLK